MKNFLLNYCCNIFVLAITIVGTSIFAQSNNSTINDELVPLVENSNQVNLGSDIGFEQLREDSAQTQKNSDSLKINFAATENSTITDTEEITDEIQLGNELRKILARKPEIPTEKIKNRNQPEFTNNHSLNYRNDNLTIADNTPTTVIRAQVTTNNDPLAGRPEPPQGSAPISSIPSTLLNDSQNTDTTNTTSTPTIYPPNNTNTNQIQNTNNEPTNNTTKNPTATEKPIIVNNDLASVVNGWLLVITIISVAALVYVAIIAVDYHQRWMQILTAQNDHYFTPQDITYNNLTDTYNTSEKSHFGKDFFSYPSI
jgi:hypothetical protein